MIARCHPRRIHASTVASDGRAVLICWPIGIGQIGPRAAPARPRLHSGQRRPTIVRNDGDRLLAGAPATIKGKLEIRGIGIVEMDTIDDVPVALFVELTSESSAFPTTAVSG